MFNPVFDYSDCEDPAPKKPGRGAPGRVKSKYSYFSWLLLVIPAGVVFALWVNAAVSATTPAEQLPPEPVKCTSWSVQLNEVNETVIYKMPFTCSAATRDSLQRILLED